MNSTQRSAYNVLIRGSRALGGLTADELMETHPRIREIQGASLAVWQGWLAARVEELAAAIAANRPALFSAQVRWAASMFAARGLKPEFVEAALQTLQSVLTRELPEPQHACVLAALEQGIAALRQNGGTDDRPLRPDSPDGKLASSYVLALLEGDRRRACDLILNTARNGRSVPEIYEHVLRPAQIEIGRMWTIDEVNVAEEHFTTATTKQLMAQLAQYAEYKPDRGHTLVTAAVAGNQHDLGLQMVADLFEMDGWRVIHLGADVPVLNVAQAVEGFQADLLGLSAALSTQLETVRQTITAVRNGPRGAAVKILVGGTAFPDAPDLFREWGADAYAADTREAIAAGNELVR